MSEKDPSPANLEPTIGDVLVSINEFATSVEQRFTGIEGRMEGIENRLSRLEAVTVTKNYLDEKLFTLRGELVSFVLKHASR